MSNRRHVIVAVKDGRVVWKKETNRPNHIKIHAPNNNSEHWRIVETGVFGGETPIATFQASALDRVEIEDYPDKI